MAAAPITVGDAIEIAVECFKSAEYQNVREVCDEILRVEPANVHALHLRALANANSNNVEQAIADLKQALIVRPDDFELLNNIGNFYKAAAQLELARESYERAVKLEPECHPAIYNLANVMVALGDEPAAFEAYDRAIELNPNFAEAYYNVGLLLRKNGDNDGALQSFKKCIAKNTDHVEAQIEIGNCLMALNRPDDAMNAYKVASLVDPNACETFNNMGVLLTEQGKYGEAKATLECALRLNSEFSAAQNNLGVVEYLLGNFGIAADLFSEVISQNPENSQAFRNLGRCLAEMGAHDEAILTYRNSLRLDPTASETLVDLASVYARAGYTKQAVEIFEQVQSMRPDSVVPLIGAAVACLPRFYETEEARLSASAEFQKLLSKVEAKLDLSDAPSIDDAVYAIGLLQPHHLRYQADSARVSLRKFGAIVDKVMSAKYPEWVKPRAIDKVAIDQRIKVGIASSALLAGSGWRTAIGGIISGISPEKFQVSEYGTGGSTLENLAERILKDAPDVLIYPELPEDAALWQLASLRLAPVQCTTWVQGQTSGLKNIDYMLSSDLVEPENGAEHYTEKLAKLPNLGFYYERIAPEPKSKEHDLPQVDLLEDSFRFLCGQPTCNYLPEQDELFVEIARRVLNAQFIFIAESTAMGEALRQRLQTKFTAEGLDSHPYIVFCPPSHPDQFGSVFAHANAFLDSVTYSDVLVSVEAVANSCPVVTLTGLAAKSRRTTGLLRQIEVTDTIATTSGEYVELAVRLATDAAWRQNLGERLKDRVHWAYRDSEAIAGFEKFLQSVVKRGAH